MTKPITLSVNDKGTVSDPWDKTKLKKFLSVKGEINRKDYKLTWNKKMDEGGWVIGDTVKLEIIIEANRVDERTAFSRFYKPTVRRSKEMRMDDLKKDPVTEEKEEDKKMVVPGLLMNQPSTIVVLLPPTCG